MMMDPFTKNALWDYWKKGDDQEVLTDEVFSDLEETYKDGEHEITYQEYKNEWFYKLNNDVPWDPEEPWLENGVPYGLIDHICEPFHFKNVKTKWPTCSLNEDGFCNGGELPRMVRVGYMTYFQYYKWYDDLIDGNLKEESLKKKAMNERSWGDATKEYWRKMNDHKCSPFTNWRNHIRGSYENTNIDAKYNPYLDVSRPFNNHAGRNDEEAIREERKPNDHGIDNFENDLVRDNSPYHANKKEEQYEEDRC
ncbi:hypothetical protein Tco_0943390 [Tanacetum coccineum]